MSSTTVSTVTAFMIREAFSAGERAKYIEWEVVNEPKTRGKIVIQKGEVRVTERERFVIYSNELEEREKKKVLRAIKLLGFLRTENPGLCEEGYARKDSIIGVIRSTGIFWNWLKGYGIAETARRFINGRIPMTALEKSIASPREVSVVDRREHASRIVGKAEELVFGQTEALQRMFIRMIGHKNDGYSDTMMVFGPSGCGKTLSLRTLAKFMEIPFIRIAMPSVSPTAYKGSNLNDVLFQELSRLGTRRGPERLVLQLDEFDKLNADGAELSSRLQNELLALLEGNGAVRSTSSREKIELNALIVLSGAFSYLKYDDYIGEDSLRKAGFIDELIGRVGVPIVLRPLVFEDYVRIITTPHPHIKLEIERLSALGIDVKFEPETIEALARAAVKSKTGARSLVTAVKDMTTTAAMGGIFGTHSLINGKRIPMRIGPEAIRTRNSSQRAIGFSR